MLPVPTDDELYYADKVRPWYYGCQMLGPDMAYKVFGFSWEQYNFCSVERWG